MSTTLDAIQNLHKSLETSLNGNANGPVHENRKKAFDLFLKQEIPSRKNEEYKFTDIGKFIKSNFDLDSANKNQRSLTENEVKQHGFLTEDVLLITLVNGALVPALSQLDQLPKGVNLRGVDGKTETCFISDTAINDAFSQLNDAFAVDGLFLEIEKNTQCKTPILIQNINTDSTLSFNHPKLKVVAGAFSETTVIEKVITLNGASFVNNAAHFTIEENAKLSHYRIQDDGPNCLEICNAIVEQAKNSTFSNYVFTLGGGLIRNNLTIRLNGQGCEANMYGLYLVGGTTHVDNHTVVDHREPNSFSNEFYKGILADKSRGVFNGKIFVREHAQKTNAFQSNNNILLSDDAVINTKPQLEIWADDVKCSHGCTTGQLDEEALFYMRARGIEKKKAMDLLLDAFASEVVEKVDFLAIKDYISEYLHQKFSN